jgi:hypothetical protein
LYQFDKNQWPIVVVVHDSAHTEADFDAYLEELDALLKSGERYVYIDVMQANMELPPFARIKRLIAWYQAHREESARWCIGTAFVIPNAAARGAANFFLQITQITKTAMPRYFAQDLEAALFWARTKLAAESLSGERVFR